MRAVCLCVENEVILKNIDLKNYEFNQSECNRWNSFMNLDYCDFYESNEKKEENETTKLRLYFDVIDIRNVNFIDFIQYCVI